MKINKENNAIKILNLLNNGEISKKEILRKLNIKQSTFYKHLKAIKKAGFNIKSTNGFYQITDYRNIISLSSHECSIFAYLYLIATNSLPKYKAKKIKESFIKALYLSNENSHKIAKEKYELYKKLLPQINFKKQNNYTTETIEIDEENTVIKIKNNFESTETIFELYNKLIYSYQLKEDERIIDKTKEKLVIASSNPNKDELFRRLLRYDTYCKVTFPAKHVNQFKEIVEKSLANLNRFSDNEVSYEFKSSN